MITGYNTDVEHDGVVYHVQTEDKGLETPLLLSLVYSGGAILASKRSTYEDLIAAGFDEAKLTERLQRQHRLICAAINAGRIDDLKKMTAPRGTEPLVAPVELDTEPLDRPAEPMLVEQPVVEELVVEKSIVEEPPLEKPESAPPDAQPTAEVLPGQPLKAPRRPSPYTVYDPRRVSPAAVTPEVEMGICIRLSGERDFRGGDTVEFEVIVRRVSGQGEEPIAAMISVKILGTAFRPVILSLKANRDGSVAVKSRIPNFKTGRAAIVVKASAAGLTTEIRRVINPG